MKNKLLFLSLVLSVSILFSACALGTNNTANQPAPTLDSHSIADITWDDRSVFTSGLIPSAQEVLERLPDATTYYIDLLIVDETKGYSGHQIVQYTNKEDVPLNAVYFRLFANIYEGVAEVSNVKINNASVEPIYEAEESSVRIPLPTSLQPGESIIIEMDFATILPKEMGGNYGLFGFFEDVLVLDLFYPVIPAYDASGWYSEVPAPNGDFPYFDASFYVVTAKVPASLTLASSGVNIDEQVDGNYRTVTFAAGPARDFYLAASERFTVKTQVIGDTTVNSYAPAEWEEGMQFALDVAVFALESFSSRFGEYPYSEFDVVSTPMLALGIEYPGITGIATALYDPDAVISGLPALVMLESVVAHEVGHQWFYNVVGSDQMQEPWVDEAVTQYVTGLYFLDRYGREGWQSFADSWDFRWSRTEYADIPIGLPAGDYVGNEYSAIVYGRGPIFLDVLATEMGQETFDAFLRDYYQSFQWELAYADDFKSLAEEYCDCDLTPMFEEWVFGD
jgi:hypothetical protein